MQTISVLAPLSCISGSLSWNFSSVLSSSCSLMNRFLSILRPAQPSIVSISCFCSAMSCDIFGRVISIRPSWGSYLYDPHRSCGRLGDLGRFRRRRARCWRSGIDGCFDFGIGAGLFIRADRRGGSKVEGKGSAVSVGEDSPAFGGWEYNRGNGSR